MTSIIWQYQNKSLRFWRAQSEYRDMEPFEIIHSWEYMRQYDNVVNIHWWYINKFYTKWNGFGKNWKICDKRFPSTLWNITYLYLFTWTNCYQMWKRFLRLFREKNQREQFVSIILLVIDEAHSSHFLQFSSSKCHFQAQVLNHVVFIMFSGIHYTNLKKTLCLCLVYNFTFVCKWVI